jgi:N4-gp56 family major capsid protein
MGQLWAVASQGGYLFSETLSDVLRHAVAPKTKFRQFADIKDAATQGKKKGDTFHWNVFSKVATAGTKLVETTTMPKTQFTITQGTMTICEYGNSVDFSEKLDNLSKQPVTEIINKVLKNDATTALDIDAFNQFQTTPLVVIPAGSTSTTAITLSTTGTAAGTNAGVALTKNHHKAIIDMMKERDIPAYQADDYFALGHPSSFRQLKNDLESVHQYLTEGFQLLMAGEVGRFESCRFVEQTNAPKAAWGGGVTNHITYFGDDTVAEGIAVPEEIRGKLPGDYGRDKGVAWYYLGGFGIVHTNPTQSRIVKWGST